MGLCLWSLTFTNVSSFSLTKEKKHAGTLQRYCQFCSRSTAKKETITMKNTVSNLCTGGESCLQFIKKMKHLWSTIKEGIPVSPFPGQVGFWESLFFFFSGTLAFVMENALSIFHINYFFLSCQKHDFFHSEKWRGS